MAIISEYEEEEKVHEKPSPSPESPSLAPFASASPGPYDETLEGLLKDQNALIFLDNVTDFLRRKSDLFKDDFMDKKIVDIVYAAKKRDAEEKKRKAEAVRQETADKRLKEDDIATASTSSTKKQEATITDATEAPENPKPKDSEDNGLTPNSGNGSDLEKYSWTQTLTEVIVLIPVRVGTRKSFVVCDIKKNHLKARMNPVRLE